VNIFVLDLNFQLNAQYHVDRHVVKMPSEAAQMLGTAYRLTHGEELDVYVLFSDGFHLKKWWLIDSDEYRLSKGNIYLDRWKVMGVGYPHHPCTQWVLASKANFRWLQQYALALNAEWKYRYGHTKNHASINRMIQTPTPDIPDIELTLFAQAMPDECKDSDPVIAYRNYYSKHKGHLFAWKKRSKPDWLD